MWTQKDRIQAYQFLRRRLVSSLVSADANDPRSPSKRVVLGTAIGLAVALLVSAVFGIIGLLAPARAEKWRQGGQVVVEKETGARFVVGDDGLLHPVLNYASARLLAGGDGTATVTVPAKSLSGMPRGVGVGIAGAPDSLPQTGRLSTGPWTRCTRRSPDRPDDAEPISSVLIGRMVGGLALPDGKAILTRLPTGERFLVADGHRHRLPDELAIVALGLAAADVVEVAPPWLNTVPAGRDLKTFDVFGTGSPGPALGGVGTRVGQVLTTGAGELYLVRTDGLSVITETESRLVLGSPGSAGAYPGARPVPLPVTAADVAAAPRSPTRTGGYPRRLPEPLAVGPHATVCADGARIVVGAGMPRTAKPISMSAPGAASEVYVPGGQGAVVAEQPAPGASSGTVYVITDTGIKYPVSGAEARAALGYGNVRPTGVPAAVLGLFPTGATLDPAQARRALAG
ncbi:type VII secretion protein EccB [Actinophytocola oryzae]|uniref:Type VII secretion protein EccB n=1 Tax=Actinophytocola oryzae TaxID=502181 RepID=A0A4R7VYZ1_9PSEU|nr:type VII secretion protein EccB [Actinophytocola oryzae]TDV54995.1 type VII secretion protein EccB [Actinophytocola oryzae]